MKTKFFKPKGNNKVPNIIKPNVPQKIINLNWPQAKVRFPLMKPNSDADKDGVKNFKDCKPFDFKRQGKAHEGYNDDKAISFDYIKDLETIGDIQKLEEEY
uniref:Uncharacterized protein n=1 Tax=viral metagenome TaxID=1070528 RepID=A0A6M3LRZ4_9ZZZZ